MNNQKNFLERLSSFTTSTCCSARTFVFIFSILYIQSAHFLDPSKFLPDDVQKYLSKPDDENHTSNDNMSTLVTFLLSLSHLLVVDRLVGGIFGLISLVYNVSYGLLVLIGSCVFDCAITTLFTVTSSIGWKLHWTTATVFIGLGVLDLVLVSWAGLMAFFYYRALRDGEQSFEKMDLIENEGYTYNSER